MIKTSRGKISGDQKLSGWDVVFEEDFSRAGLKCNS